MATDAAAIAMAMMNGRGGGSGGDVSKAYVDEHLALKVDKIEGKSLSSNDYTNADKSTVGNSPIANSATGTSFSLTGAANAPLAGLVIEGRTTKTGDTITNVGDNGLSVGACGKNIRGKLIPNSAIYFENGGLTPIEGYQATDYIYVEKNQPYVISYNTAGSENWFYALDKTPIAALPNTYPTTVFTPQSNGYIRCSCHDENVNAFQIEKGTIATTYEPYKGSTATLSTGLPLCSLTGIKDAADFTAAVVHKRCEKFVLNGSEELEQHPLAPTDATGGKLFGTSVAVSAYNPIDDNDNPHISSSLNSASLSVVYNGTTNTIWCGGSAIYLRISSIATVADLKTYLASNPVTIVYELAEPYDTPMTASEVAAYHDLRTFENTTNITCTDSPQMNLNYMLNTENGAAIGNIQQQFINTVPMSMIAPAFSTTETYAVGDFVIYNYSLYKCTTAVQTAGAWDAASWTAATVADMLTA